MDNAKKTEIRQWYRKSQRDLESARRLMEGDEPYCDTAVYHCQQAAEKAIKAYLTSRDIVFTKTHNLVSLIALCLPEESKFAQWEEEAEILTPYATEFRYPGPVLEPEQEEAEEALLHAQGLVHFVAQLLPTEVWVDTSG
jgi:HEPN domain-containing protein